jgi:hypothetical protein
MHRVAALTTIYEMPFVSDFVIPSGFASGTNAATSR